MPNSSADVRGKMNVRILIIIGCVSAFIFLLASQYAVTDNPLDNTVTKKELIEQNTSVVRVGMPLDEAIKIIEKRYGKSQVLLPIMPPRGRTGTYLGLKEWDISPGINRNRYLVLFHTESEGNQLVEQISLFATPVSSKQGTVQFNVSEVNLRNL
jgi:hypothetical protein